MCGSAALRWRRREPAARLGPARFIGSRSDAKKGEFRALDSAGLAPEKALSLFCAPSTVLSQFRLSPPTILPTAPTPPAERVEIPNPWDEGMATKLPTPGIPPRGKGKPPK